MNLETPEYKAAEILTQVTASGYRCVQFYINSLYEAMYLEFA